MLCLRNSRESLGFLRGNSAAHRLLQQMTERVPLKFLTASFLDEFPNVGGARLPTEDAKLSVEVRTTPGCIA